MLYREYNSQRFRGSSSPEVPESYLVWRVQGLWCRAGRVQYFRQRLYVEHRAWDLGG